MLKVTHGGKRGPDAKEVARGVQKPNMGTLFITSFFLLGIIIFALYLRHNASSSSDDSAGHALPPDGRFGGLFGVHSETPSPDDKAAPDVEDAERRASLLARAASGERETLDEALSSGDAKLYDEVLNALVLSVSESDAGLLALVSYITRAESLRVNRGLAEALMLNWQKSPGRAATAKMLHLVALADDASLYQRAVELALQFWRAGRVQDLSAAELRALADGEYWVLTSHSRSSGAGFLLKRMLAHLRRELEDPK
ncbi:MAG TPA: hypothetical protein VGO91_20325 [Pyrinomonadaceae bacterium]|nr:hypothetical protein [Pyrinomonadaceae bacterium]